MTKVPGEDLKSTEGANAEGAEWLTVQRGLPVHGR